MTDQGATTATPTEESIPDMDETAGPTIGQRIAHLRGTRLTQTSLASAAGVSVDLIRKLEQGRRHTVSITSLHCIARALDVDAGDLLAKTRSLPDPGEYSGAGAAAAHSPTSTTSSTTSPTSSH